MPEIFLSRGGRTVLYDDCDSRLVTSGIWKARLIDGKWYVTSIDGQAFLHRVMLNAPRGIMVDHRNGDGLDNRRLNLRLATNSQNQANRGTRCGVVPFKGVTLTTGGRKPFAQIKVHGRSIYLGTFSNPADAARAYDQAALKYFGEFANINFPGEASA